MTTLAGVITRQPGTLPSPHGQFIMGVVSALLFGLTVTAFVLSRSGISALAAALALVSCVTSFGIASSRARRRRADDPTA